MKDNSRTSVSALGRHTRRHKRHKDVYLLGRRAAQANQNPASPSQRATPRKRQQPHVRERIRAPAWAPQTPQGGVPPWDLGSSGRLPLSVFTPTSSQAPKRENDNNRTCVGKPGHQLGRRKHHKERNPLGSWAPQADEQSASSLPPLRKRHNAKTTSVARSWARLGVSPHAARATRRCTPLRAGLNKPTKPPRPRLVPPRRENNTSRTCVGTSGRQPRRHRRLKDVYLRWRLAPQADQTSKPSPPPRHNAKTTTAARASTVLGASPGAADATRRWSSSSAGLNKRTKS